MHKRLWLPPHWSGWPPLSADSPIVGASHSEPALSGGAAFPTVWALLGGAGSSIWGTREPADLY